MCLPRAKSWAGTSKNFIINLNTMKKTFRIILAIIFFAAGSSLISYGVYSLLHGKDWLSQSLFGLALVVAGIAMLSGDKAAKIIDDLISAFIYNR